MKGIKLVFFLSVITIKCYAQNYDETKVPAYTLPDPLKTLSNTGVTDKTKWETVRRPEIVTLFENNICKNYGSDTLLLVKGSAATGYWRSSYLKFSVSGVSNITSAKLRIYGCNTENTSGINLSIYGVNDSWTENGIYFSIAPAASTSALSAFSVNNVKKYYEFDVTGFVKTQATRDKVVSFLIKNPGNQDKLAVFSSKENRQNRPQLVITTSTAIITNYAEFNRNSNFYSAKGGFKNPELFPDPLPNIFR